MTIRAAIVDDEPLARRRIRNLLAEARDVEVVAECANGKEAIASLEASPPDLLYLDIQMPEIDGFDVLRRIRVHDRHRPDFDLVGPARVPDPQRVDAGQERAGTGPRRR